MEQRMSAEDKAAEGRRFVEWQQRCRSKEYCLSKIPKSEAHPSEEALPEADAVVTEQILIEKLSGLTNVDRAKKLSTNSFIEQYAFAFYTTENFELWNHMSVRTYKNLPERKPTITERIRFEKLFYQVLRYVIMEDERFEAEMHVEKFSLADINRLENFFGFFVQCVTPEHDVLAFLKGPKAIAVYEKVSDIRHKKGKYWVTPKGWCNMGFWAIFDEVQVEMEYECSDDPNLPEPVAPTPWT